MKYLPWIVGLGVLAWMFCPYFQDGDEVTSGKKSLRAVEKAIRKMN